jgi:hypothetical protein
VVAIEWLGGLIEFDEACEMAADLWLKEVSLSEAARKSTRIGGSSIVKSPNVESDFLNAHVRIVADYFGSNSCLECSAFPGLSFPSIPAQPRYSDELFQRRFRKPRNLFVRIVNAVQADEVYFTWRKDAVGKSGASGLQKAVSALRQLAYGTAADSTDECSSSHCCRQHEKAQACLSPPNLEERPGSFI